MSAKMTVSPAARRLTDQERVTIARVVTALARGEAGKAEVAGLYRAAGYRACWHSGEEHGMDAVHRFASFHLDRIGALTSHRLSLILSLPFLDPFTAFP